MVDPNEEPGEDLLSAIEKEEEGLVLPLAEPVTPQEYVAVQALPKEQRSLLDEVPADADPLPEYTPPVRDVYDDLLDAAPEELKDDLDNNGHQPI